MRAPYTMVRSTWEDHGPAMRPQIAVLDEDQWFEESAEVLRDWGIDAQAPITLAACHCSELGLCGYGDQCHKAAIPLSKLKGLLDEDDIPVIKDTRCNKCANCPTCKLSGRAKTQSLQESFEQEVIEKSVTVDLERCMVRVRVECGNF